MEPVEFVDLETTAFLVIEVDLEELECEIKQIEEGQRIFPSDLQRTFTI